MIGRRYLDPGDRLSGRNDPPEVVTVLTRWGPGGGPRNVLVRRPDGTRQVIPFPRRLRRLDAQVIRDRWTLPGRLRQDLRPGDAVCGLAGEGEG